MGRIRRKLGDVFRRKLASSARGTLRLTRTKMNASSNSPHHAGSEDRLPVASGPSEHQLARSLAGATTLQIIPMLNEEPPVRAALRISGALLRAGARSLIASGGGALVSELHAQGGEWIQFPNAHVNRWKLGRCARALEEIVTAENVDVIHALGGAGAAAALAVRERVPLRVITSLPDGPHKRYWYDGRNLEALTRGERMIVRSAYAASPIIGQYDIPDSRIVVIPDSVETEKLNPAAIHRENTNEIRSAWRVGSGARVFIAPGPVAAWSGHIALVDAVRVLVNGGLDGAVFVIPCDDESDPKDICALSERAAAQGVEPWFRFFDPAGDIASLLSAADIVVIPATEPPPDACVVAEAQALARPVIASAIGALPESILAPPRATRESLTGWLVRPEDSVELASTISAVLALDVDAIRDIGLRARRFAEATFSPQSVAAATLAVYTSVLGGG
jgi:glycosyltransferase involved in cell wall biosynthesis